MAETAGDFPCAGGEGEERIQSGEEEIQESNEFVGDEDRSAISSAYLVELNLVMMVAFLTLSADEFLRSDEDPEKIVAREERQVREAAAAKLKRRRIRQPEEYKAADRQAISRSQRKILDSRHGRKM